MSWKDTIAAGIHGFTDGIVPLAETGAVADTFLGTPGRPSIWHSKAKILEILMKNYHANQKILEQERQQHPTAHYAGETGGIAVSLAGLAKTLTRAAARKIYQLLPEQALSEAIHIPKSVPMKVATVPKKVVTTYPGPTVIHPSEDTAKKAAEEWFQNMRAENPHTMLHGSSRGNITEFDPYAHGNHGLMGQGTYLTDSPEVALGYTKKGLRGVDSPSRTLYAVDPHVNNPLPMDAPLSIDNWANVQKHYPDWADGIRSLSAAGIKPTNEHGYRELEDILRAQELPKWEGAEAAQDAVRGMGYDGIVHTGGGRIAADSTQHNVLVAFDPEQTPITGKLNIDNLLKPQLRERDWIDLKAQIVQALAKGPQ